MGVRRTYGVRSTYGIQGVTEYRGGVWRGWYHAEQILVVVSKMHGACKDRTTPYEVVAQPTAYERGSTSRRPPAVVPSVHFGARRAWKEEHKDDG